MTDVKTGLSDNPGLERWEQAGAVYYALDSPTAPVADELLLLPIYDEYIMGYKDRSMYFLPGTALT